MYAECKRETDTLNWTYEAVAEQVCHSDLGRFSTFGLRATDAEGRETFLHDVSPDWTVASRLAALFTRHQLSPLHMRDAASDMLP